MVTDVFDHSLFVGPGKDLLQGVLTHLLGQGAPVPPHHVQSFYFLFVNGHNVGVPQNVFEVVHLETGVLLLLEQKQWLEYSIHFYFQHVVLLVDFPFDFVADGQCLLDLVSVDIDHDAVGVAIDDVKRELGFDESGTGLEQLAASASDEGGNVLSVEPTLFESQTPIDTIGNQLISLLLGVQQPFHELILLQLQLLLHFLSLPHQFPQDLRQYPIPFLPLLIPRQPLIPR